MPTLGAAAVDLVAQFAVGVELADAQHRDLRMIGMPRRFRRVRRHRPEALAVADEIGDRQVLVAHHHDVVVEPGLIDLAPLAIGHRLDVDAGHLDADLRPHAADFDHRSFLPNAIARRSARGSDRCQTENGHGCHAPERLISASAIGEEIMKLVLFEAAGHGEPVPGLLTDRGVVSLADVVERGHTPQLDDAEHDRRVRRGCGRRSSGWRPRARRCRSTAVRLRPPLPRPGKILVLHRQLLGARAARGAAAQHVPQEPRGGGRAGRHDPAAGIHRAVDLHARGRAGAGHQGAGQKGRPRRIGAARSSAIPA